jgi:hypothetical protein
MLSAVDEMPKLAHSESPGQPHPRRAHEAGSNGIQLTYLWA